MIFARCPACSTTFRLKPEQLRARQGRVRCGQCRHAFNALETLIDENELAVQLAPSVTPPPGGDDSPADSPLFVLEEKSEDLHQDALAAAAAPEAPQEPAEPLSPTPEAEPIPFLLTEPEPEPEPAAQDMPAPVDALEPSEGFMRRDTPADEDLIDPDLSAALEALEAMDKAERREPEGEISPELGPDTGPEILAESTPTFLPDLTPNGDEVALDESALFDAPLPDLPGAPPVEPEEPAALELPPDPSPPLPPLADESLMPELSFEEVSFPGNTSPSRPLTLPPRTENTPDAGSAEAAPEDASAITPPDETEARIEPATDDAPLSLLPDTERQEPKISDPAPEQPAAEEGSAVTAETASPPQASTGNDEPSTAQGPDTSGARPMEPLPRAPFRPEDFEPRRSSPMQQIMWAAGSTVLAVLLAAQGAMVFRTELAQAMPELRPALEDLCAGLGCEMPLPRQAQLITIESSDIQPDASKEAFFTLHATLRNQADFAQAYPHLEITLTNARDQALVRRVLTPLEWLSGDAPASAFPSHKDVQARVYFEAPGVAAAGYRVYAFYP